MTRPSATWLAAVHSAVWRLVCLAIGVGVASAFFLQFCDLMFDCGCEASWAAAADHCNIHAAEPPHCPWCVQDGANGRITYGLIVPAQAVLAFWPGDFSRGRAAAVLLAFPAVGALCAVVAGVVTGYWN